mmetsp:Transcript_23246/g.53113  ORF Transcript_23246/g.53113 Transcript_23246/m.53113 type:complete len:175 (-) Transcript_23246:21-545(-)
MVKCAEKVRRQKKHFVSSRLQIELQPLIGYACYDNDAVLKGGKSSKLKYIRDKVFDLYMPSTNSKDDRVSYVELFLKGRGRFKCLFDKVPVDDVEKLENNILTDEKLVIPPFFSGMGDTAAFIGKTSINMSVLTRKNKSNPQDISAKTLYNHAKDVERNCKKALAICLAPNSPY